MPNFTEAQKTRIRRFLGYANLDSLGSNTLSISTLNDRLDFSYEQEFVFIVDDLLADLESIDTQLRSLIAASSIKQADVVIFDYKANYKLLFNYGSNLVKELANLIGVPVLNNKYSNGSGSNQISFRSY